MNLIKSPSTFLVLIQFSYQINSTSVLYKFFQQQIVNTNYIDNIITNSILPRLSSLMLQATLEQKSYTKATLSVQDGAIAITLDA